MLLKSIPVDDMTNVTKTCYSVHGKTLSYYYTPQIFDDYEEAFNHYTALKSSELGNEPTTHAWINEHLAGYWELGGITIVECEYGRERM